MIWALCVIAVAVSFFAMGTSFGMFHVKLEAYERGFMRATRKNGKTTFTWDVE